MADTVSKEVRSRNMAAIRSKNTKPEISFRKSLHRLGYRYSVHKGGLPGRPDIFLPKHNSVVFVHGCFWHQHQNCRYAAIPKSNKRFWLPKLKKNVERDKENIKKLKKLGYNVYVVWECNIAGRRNKKRSNTELVKLHKRLRMDG